MGVFLLVSICNQTLANVCWIAQVCALRLGSPTRRARSVRRKKLSENHGQTIVGGSLSRQGQEEQSRCFGAQCQRDGLCTCFFLSYALDNVCLSITLACIPY